MSSIETLEHEELDFQVHPNLLRHVIERQAPSLAKAGLEGAMNAVDSGASRLDILVSEHLLVMEDNGRGFGADIDEIKRVFGTFGEPHAEEDVPMGEFRMGRGQILSHGATTYESGPFRFTIDLRTKGRTWQIGRTGSFQPGCRITVHLYSPVGTDVVKQELMELVKYLPIDIRIDGERVTEVPANVKWDLETPDAWIKIGPGPLKVYNRGAFVRDYPAETKGIGGIVVTKERLKVTFGRNEVMQSCPVFARIMKALDQAFLNALRSRKSSSLPETMRLRAVRMLVSGQIDLEDVWSFYLLRDATGAGLTLRALTRFSAVTAGPLGDPRAIRAITTGKAMVIASETLDDLNVPLKRLVDTLAKNGYPAPAVLIWEALLAEIVLGKTPVPDEALDPHERALLFGAQMASRAIAGLMTKSGRMEGTVPVRRVIAASRDSEDVFSDGETYIGLGGDLLERLAKGDFSLSKAVAHLLDGYVRYPVPTDGTEEAPGSIEAMLTEQASLTWLRGLLTDPIEGLSVPRSPLTGDPHHTRGFWSAHAAVRDLGDVARLWADDYVRRCPGLGIQPKLHLAKAANVGMGRLAAEEGQGAAEASTPEDLPSWLEAFRLTIAPSLSTLGLEHWTFSLEKRMLVATRNRPGRTPYDRAGAYSGGCRVKYLLGYDYNQEAEKVDDAKRWASERMRQSKEPVTAFSFVIIRKGKPVAIADIIQKVTKVLVAGEFVIGKFGISSHDEFDKPHVIQLTALSPCRQWTDPRLRDVAATAAVRSGRGFGGQAVGVVPDYYEKVGPIKEILPRVRFSFMGDGSIAVTLRAEYGPFAFVPAAPRRRGESLSRTLRISSYLISFFGWPRVARVLRRFILAEAGERALLKRARQQQPKCRAADAPFPTSDEGA